MYITYSTATLKQTLLRNEYPVQKSANHLEYLNMFYLWIQTGERYVDVSHKSGLSSRTIGVVAIVGTAASSTACVRTASVGATCVGAAADDTAAETISVLFILKK